MSALLIGATGMLRDAAAEIVRGADGAVLMARHASGFRFGDQFGDRAGDRALDEKCVRLDADWADEAAFAGAVRAAAAAHGGFAQALVWLHRRAPAVREAVCDAMADGGTLVEVLGSAASRPRDGEHLSFADQRREAMRARPGIAYRQVQLGFVMEDGAARWLTHAEISAAALAAMAGGEPRVTAGQVEPWEKRPA